MATLANIFNHVMGAKGAATADPLPRSLAGSDCFKLRPLPNEDVYFFVKRIDNSRVVRQADPGARAQSWQFLGGSCAAAVLLIGMLLPSAYGLLAGYQITNLQKEHGRLVTERATLELEEAKLVSPERLQELANRQEFIDPTPDRIIYLTPKNDESLALNRSK